MRLETLTNIDQASERDMLNYILSTQLQLMRRLDVMEVNISMLHADASYHKDTVSHFETTKDMIFKTDSFIDRINDFLSADDSAKGIITT